MVYQLEAIERSDWECFLCVSDAAGRSAPGHELRLETPSWSRALLVRSVTPFSGGGHGIL